jgi:CIC family chloride channel protein
MAGLPASTASAGGFERARRWLRRRAWLARWLPAREQRITYSWAVVAGFSAAACVLLVRFGLESTQWLLTQSFDPLIQVAHDLPPWRRLLTPALGGIIAGWLVFWGRRFTRDQTAVDYMEAVTVGDGVVRGRPALLRCIAALFSIGSGGSLGREGPLLQLSTAVISSAGRHLGLGPPQLPLVVACSAAAAIAATYHAPLAGALFVAEIVLGTIAVESFGPIVVSSVVAVAVTRPILGSQALFPGTVFRFQSAWELLLFLIVGIVLGGLAPVLVRLLERARTAFNALQFPLHWQLGLGGLLVGAISILVPEVWGNGFESLQAILRGDSGTWTFVGLLLAAKLVATVASVGSGAVGGVFTPVMLMGGLGGWILGAVFHSLWPTHTGTAAAYALIGMGAFLGATTHAPLMAVVMVFELTLNPDAIAPLLIATVAAQTVARSVSSDSIYSASLRARTTHQRSIPGFRSLFQPPPPTLSVNAPLEQVAIAFRNAPAGIVAVTESNGQLVGSIRIGDVRTHLTDPMLARLVTAGELIAGNPAWIVADAEPGTALARFTETDEALLLVVDAPDTRRVTGCLSRRDVLLWLAHGTRW